MARFVGASRSFVTTRAAAVSLGNAAGDVATGMLCPTDGAKVVSVSYTIQTAGVGAAANHNLDLEQGLAGAGEALTGTIAVDADAAAGTIVTGNGLEFSQQPITQEGRVIQVKNAESAAISTGAILDISVLWQL